MNRMKLFMDDNFQDFIKNDSQLIITSVEIQSRINQCFDNNETNDFFYKQKETNNNRNFVYIHQKNYIHLFFIMYLGYIQKLVSNQLNKSFGTKWINKKIAYSMSVEKLLLEDINISKDDIQQLAAISFIPQEKNKQRKLRVITQGDCILPAIQRSLGVEPKILSHFAIVNLYETYIHIAVHHVVKKLDSGENGSSTIIIAEKLIRIKNINDSLCKNIWNTILLKQLINCFF